jgi:hypothetical protein
MSISDFIKGFKNRVYTNRFYLLFAALVLNLIIPEIKEFPLLLVIFQILTTMAGVNLIDEKKPALRKAWFVMSILMLTSILLEYLKPDFISDKIIYAFFFVFYIMITINLFMQIRKLQVISADVIIGAFCGYMLIGLMGFFVFTIIEKFTPGSFSNLMDGHKKESLYYFSYINLTTTGFGDIVPLTTYARKVSILFAMIGQFYMGVVIAILISKYLQNPSGKQN